MGKKSEWDWGSDAGTLRGVTHQRGAYPRASQDDKAIERRRDEILIRDLTEELAHEPNPLRRNEISGRIVGLWRKLHPGGLVEDDVLSA